MLRILKSPFSVLKEQLRPYFSWTFSSAYLSLLQRLFLSHYFKVQELPSEVKCGINSAAEA